MTSHNLGHPISNRISLVTSIINSEIMDSPTRLPFLVSTHSPISYYYSLTSIFCIAGKQCTCYCCLYYEDVLDAFLPILCRTSPWDQFQKNQGNEIVVYYLLFTGFTWISTQSLLLADISLELLLQLLLLLVTVLLLLLYYDRHLYTVTDNYRHWLFICIYCLSILFTVTGKEAIYMHLLHIYTFYRLQLFICFYQLFIHFIVTGNLYILQTLAACIVLCVFTGCLIKGYHYLIAKSSHFISFEKFFFLEPQIQLQL